MKTLGPRARSFAVRAATVLSAEQAKIRICLPDRSGRADGGAGLMEGLRLVQSAVGNPARRVDISTSIAAIRDGATLSATLGQNSLLLEPLRHAITLGEQSNRLADMRGPSHERWRCEGGPSLSIRLFRHFRSVCRMLSKWGS